MTFSSSRPPRPVGRRRSNRRRSIALLVAIGVSGISIVGYFALSLAINTLPPDPDPLSLPWAAVIQPTSELQADQVSLQARTVYNQDGTIYYTVSVCGPYPYRANLILYGLQSDASAQYVVNGHEATTHFVPVRAEPFGITYPLDGADVETGFDSVQEVSLNFPHVASCPASLVQQLISGVRQPYEVKVIGTLSNPWAYRTKMFGGIWQGPHASLTLPTVGDIGSLTGGVPAPFTLNRSHEKWTQPTHENVMVSAAIPFDWSMESAIPTPSTANTPVWSSHIGISPTAQFTVPSQLALLQDFIVAFAILVGIGGGFLASVLVEFFRPQPEPRDSQISDTVTSPQQQRPALTSASSARPKGRFALIGRQSLSRGGLRISDEVLVHSSEFELIAIAAAEMAAAALGYEPASLSVTSAHPAKDGSWVVELEGKQETTGYHELLRAIVPEGAPETARIFITHQF